MRMMLHKKTVINYSLWALTVVVFSITAVIMFQSCQKNNTIFPGTQHNDFFRNGDQVFDLVQKVIRMDHPEQKLLVIDRITYQRAEGKRYAMVYYRTAKGQANLVLEREEESEDETSDEFGYTSYVCDGSCGCLVTITIGISGKIKVSCSCSPCNLISHTF